MSKITREDIGAQHAKLTVVLEQADYAPKYNSEIKKIAKTAQIKGFRKGKVPTSFLKKVHGESILADVVFESISREMNEYLEKENISLVGSPIPAENTQISISPVTLVDYTVAYEIGILPELDLKGISKKDKIETYDVAVPQDWVDADIDRFKKQMGERKEVEEPIMEGDVFKVKAVESGKKDGLEVEFDIFFNSLTDEAKDTFNGNKNGFSTKVNVFELEEGMTEKSVRKYLLNLEDDDEREVGQEFDVTIQSVTRIFPAELNEENLKQVFGPESKATNEAEAREQLQEYVKDSFKNGLDNLFITEVMDHILAKNPLTLPEEFFKKWLTFESRQQQRAAPSDEQIQSEKENFIRRTIINKLIEDNEVQVEEVPLREALKKKVSGMMQGQRMDPSFLDTMVDNILKSDQYRDFVNEAINEVAMVELTKKLRDQFKLDVKSIDYDTFKAKMEALNARFKPAEPTLEDLTNTAEGDDDEEEEEEVSSEAIFE